MTASMTAETIVGMCSDCGFLREVEVRYTDRSKLRHICGQCKALEVMRKPAAIEQTVRKIRRTA